MIDCAMLSDRSQSRQPARGGYQPCVLRRSRCEAGAQARRRGTTGCSRGVDCAADRAARTRTGLRSCDGAKVKEGRLIQERRRPMMKIIAAAAFLAAPWQPAHAQAIVGSIPEEFRGDWCQENTKDNIFKPGGGKLKAGSLSIDRMTLDTGRLSCGFDSGAASEGTLQMQMLCTDPEDKESLMYGAQLKLLPGKKIELILEPTDQK